MDDVRPRRSVGSFLALAVAALSTLFAIALVVAILSGPYRALERSDYLTYHVAGRLVLEARGDCLYDLECQREAEQRVLGGPAVELLVRHLPFTSPPWLAILAAPLALLPLSVGFGIFTAIGFAVLALGVWRLAPFTGRDRVVAAALLLTAWPTAVAVIRGQATLLVAGLIGLAIAALVQRQERRAGILAGLAVLKPTLLPLWVARLLVERRWAVLAVGAAVVIGLVVLTALIVSPQALLDYPRFLLQVGGADVPGVHPEQMMNWRSVEVRLGLEGSGVAVAGTVVTLGLVGLSWWAARGSPAAPAIGAATALLATPLVIPHANQHEAILASIGVLIAVAALGEAKPWLRVLAVATAAGLWVGPLLTNEGGGRLLLLVTLGWLALTTLVGLRVRIR